MNKPRFSNIVRSTGLRAGARELVFSFYVCSLLLAGALHGEGTGTLDHSSGWYPSGTNLTVTATPTDIYSRFDHWAYDVNSNDVSIVSTQLTLSVNAPGIVTAHFADATTTLNAIPYNWLHIVNTNWTTISDFESAVTNDPDGDGFTTAQEYWSGTDPFSDTSYLHISGVTMAAGKIQLNWYHAHVGSNLPPICLQVRTNLMHGSWEYAGEISPSDGLNSWTSNPLPNAYYRLCVTNAP